MTIETNSATWQTIRGHAEAEIARSQTRLEITGLPIAETEHTRGRIKALRDILALAEPRTEIPASIPPFV